MIVIVAGFFFLILIAGVVILTALSKVNPCVGDAAYCTLKFVTPKSNGINLSDPYQILVFGIIVVLVFVAVYLSISAWYDNRQNKAIKQYNQQIADNDTLASSVAPGHFRRGKNW